MKNNKPKSIKISDSLVEYQYQDDEKTILLCTPHNGQPHVLFGFKQYEDGLKVLQTKAEDLPQGFAEEVWIDAQCWFAGKLAELTPDET